MKVSAPEYVINRYVFLGSGAELLVLNDSSPSLSEEHSFYSCGSLVLHVWKHVSISVQRKGRAGVTELLRNDFRRHSGCQRDGGRRVALAPPVRDLFSTRLVNKAVHDALEHRSCAALTGLHRRWAVSLR